MQTLDRIRRAINADPQILADFIVQRNLTIIGPAVHFFGYVLVTLAINEEQAAIVRQTRNIARARVSGFKSALTTQVGANFFWTTLKRWSA
jgi:hypothetical protein